MDSAQAQLVEKLQTSANILVTVSRNPTVDQLAACVGLTLLLNKLDKHATAVFSGEVPSTLEFLEPGATLEKNTDSLRDFIIALDKTKADKLRYKVEDDMVRIFITPYRISLSDKDLEFSQGDFNVDVVVALGVTRQEDFDEAITAHGRILHDATVGSISINGGVELGGINWSNASASSLSEMIVSLAHGLGENLLDQQVATALLTGIVSETARFSNEKTTPQTMSVSAELMAAGANQQLVATKLDEPVVVKEPEPLQTEAELLTEDSDVVEAEPQQSADGTLEIDHEHVDDIIKELELNDTELPAPVQNDEPEFKDSTDEEPQSSLADNNPSRLILEAPALGGTLTANSEPERLDPANDILGVTAGDQQPILNRSPLPYQAADREETEQKQEADPVKPVEEKPQPPKRTAPSFTPPSPGWTPPESKPLEINSNRTLSEIEAAVHESEQATAVESLDDARDEVSRALNSQPPTPEPVQALGAQPLGEPLHASEEPAPASGSDFSDVLNQVIPPTQLSDTLPVPPAAATPAPTVTNPTAPPPVPPPIPLNFGPPLPPQQ